MKHTDTLKQLSTYRKEQYDKRQLNIYHASSNEIK